MSLAVRSRLKVLTAGHKRKHDVDACRAEVGGCISGYTYIRRKMLLLSILMQQVTCIARAQLVNTPGKMLCCVACQPMNVADLVDHPG